MSEGDREFFSGVCPTKTVLVIVDIPACNLTQLIRVISYDLTDETMIF